jgi:N utilization substance protein B
MTGEPIESLLQFSWIDPERKEKLDTETVSFARLLIQGTLENIDLIDSSIQARLEHWDISRLSKVDLAILRMSAYALLYQNDIPKSVTIDEAVDISKKYGNSDSYRFINGVLDGINSE